MSEFSDLYMDWLDAFDKIVNAISMDTSARILAVTYVHGNNEALVHNKKYMLEIKHIQKRFGIEGCGTPPHHANDNDKGEAIFKTHAPEWAHKLFQDRYDIKLIN